MRVILAHGENDHKRNFFTLPDLKRNAVGYLELPALPHSPYDLRSYQNSKLVPANFGCRFQKRDSWHRAAVPSALGETHGNPKSFPATCSDNRLGEICTEFCSRKSSTSILSKPAVHEAQRSEDVDA